MLELIPAPLGRALRRKRAGWHQLAMNQAFHAAPHTIHVLSSAFADREAIPVSYTDDGSGISPPLAWHGVPTRTRSLILLIEDADSPTPHPLVHAIAWDLPCRDSELEPGALRAHDRSGLGRNSFFQRSYLPPDPPCGHGRHRYVFQLFASDLALPDEPAPGRTGLLRALGGHVIAKGCLIGTYER